MSFATGCRWGQFPRELSFEGIIHDLPQHLCGF